MSFKKTLLLEFTDLQISRTSYHFQGLYSPGKLLTKIEVLSGISRTRMNPVNSHDLRGRISIDITRKNLLIAVRAFKGVKNLKKTLKRVKN